MPSETQVSAVLSPDLLQAVERAATRRHVSVSQVIREAVREWAERWEGVAPERKKGAKAKRAGGRR